MSLGRLSRCSYLIKNYSNYKTIGLTQKCVQKIGGIYNINYDQNLINNYLYTGTIVGDMDVYKNIHGMYLEMPIDGKILEFNYNYHNNDYDKIDWLFKLENINIEEELLVYAF
jgi:glycine cleavage system H lipoate-binding protein